MAPLSGSSVGIDIGATKIAAGLVDADGRVVRERRLATASTSGGTAVLRSCVHVAHELAAGETNSVGIGLCELVDRAGRIQSAETLDWRNIDIVSAFAPMKVTVESDVRAAARAEALYGAGRHFREFVYFSVGTGVSYCLVVAGEPRLGARGNAIIVGAPPVEGVASGKALAVAAGTSAEDALRNDVHGAAVLHAADALGASLAALVNALDPDAVVVGGGLGLNEQYRDLVARATRAAIYAESTRRLPIIPAQLGKQSGLVGAAIVAMRARQGAHMPSVDATG